VTFPARYPGRCGACSERIHEGDPIKMVDDVAVHDDCDTLPAIPLRENPVCPKCWLTHPKGACERE